MSNHHSLAGIVSLIILAYFSIGLVFPYSWFIRQNSIVYFDMCVGSDTQLVVADRDILWPMRGRSFSQVVKIDNQTLIETTMTRDAQFGYEEDGIVSYYVRWDEPVLETGHYGVQSYIEIYPLPGITVTTFEAIDEEREFDVVECDDEQANQDNYTSRSLS